MNAAIKKKKGHQQKSRNIQDLSESWSRSLGKQWKQTWFPLIVLLPPGRQSNRADFVLKYTHSVDQRDQCTVKQLSRQHRKRKIALFWKTTGKKNHTQAWGYCDTQLAFGRIKYSWEIQISPIIYIIYIYLYRWSLALRVPCVCKIDWHSCHRLYPMTSPVHSRAALEGPRQSWPGEVPKVPQAQSTVVLSPPQVQSYSAALVI